MLKSGVSGSNRRRTIASQHPWLYVYAACTMLLVTVNVVRMLHGSAPREPGENSPLTVFWLFAITTGYLILSWSRLGVIAVLSFVLVLQAVGLLQALFRLDLYGSASEVFFIAFEVVLLRQLSNDAKNDRNR